MIGNAGKISTGRSEEKEEEEKKMAEYGKVKVDVNEISKLNFFLSINLEIKSFLINILELQVKWKKLMYFPSFSLIFVPKSFWFFFLKLFITTKATEIRTANFFQN